MDFDFMNLGVKRRRKDSAWPHDADRTEPQDDDLSEELEDQEEPFAEEPGKPNGPPEETPARRRRKDLSSLAGGEERLDALTRFGETNFLPDPEKKELEFEAGKVRTALKHGPAEDAAEPLRKLDAAHRRTLGPKVAPPKQPTLEETTHLPYLNREQQAADARRPDYKHKVALVQKKLERTRDPQLRWTIEAPQALSVASTPVRHGVTDVQEAPKTPKTPEKPDGSGARFTRFLNGLMGDAPKTAPKTAPTGEGAASALDDNRMRDAFERGQNTAREAAAAGYPGAVQVADQGGYDPSEATSPSINGDTQAPVDFLEDEGRARKTRTETDRAIPSAREVLEAPAGPSAVDPGYTLRWGDAQRNETKSRLIDEIEQTAERLDALRKTPEQSPGDADAARRVNALLREQFAHLAQTVEDPMEIQRRALELGLVDGEAATIPEIALLYRDSASALARTSISLASGEKIAMPEAFEEMASIAKRQKSGPRLLETFKDLAIYTRAIGELDLSHLSQRERDNIFREAGRHLGASAYRLLDSFEAEAGILTARARSARQEQLNLGAFSDGVQTAALLDFDETERSAFLDGVRESTGRQVYSQIIPEVSGGAHAAMAFADVVRPALSAISVRRLTPEQLLDDAARQAEWQAFVRESATTTHATFAVPPLPRTLFRKLRPTSEANLLRQGGGLLSDKLIVGRDGIVYELTQNGLYHRIRENGLARIATPEEVRLAGARLPEPVEQRVLGLEFQGQVGRAIEADPHRKAVIVWVGGRRIVTFPDFLLGDPRRIGDDSVTGILEVTRQIDLMRKLRQLKNHVLAARKEGVPFNLAIRKGTLVPEAVEKLIKNAKGRIFSFNPDTLDFERLL